MSNERDEVRDERLRIQTYEEAARVAHLYLEEFCDESLPFPAMVADSCREAHYKIKSLQKELKSAQEKLEIARASLTSIRKWVETHHDDQLLHAIDEDLKKINGEVKG